MLYKFKEYKKSELVRNHLKMGEANPTGEKIDVTNLYFERNGKPWIAVMGEYHFSRDSRDNWYKELCKMKAGGITVVATYLFWIYHEEIEGKFNFSGDLDIRTFVEEAKRAGLDVVIRIGPWAHGECRNGGFPDWLLKKPYEIRKNNDEYLEKAKIWYEKIYDEVKGLFYRDGGNIVGIQFENELVDDAEHLAKLKEIALEIGYTAPIYTVTGWNSSSGAKIPVDEVVPVFGGYIEAPWEGHTDRLLPSSHYFFNGMRNDSAIGTDLIAQTKSDGWQLPYERYPFATCELGGGIEVTHHRRPLIRPMDIYALSLVKLGCGNNLIGYYMYHGGTNKIGNLSTFNETKATGYPNDYPILSYDFQAPLSEYGEVREQYGMLNLLHLFAEDFGEIIAPMEYTESENSVTRNDLSSLRYGMRTNGESGFVFVNHYQRLDKITDIKEVEIKACDVTFPIIDVCGDICFFVPFNMDLAGNKLEYATAQPICKNNDTYFFVAIDGILPEYKFSNGEIIKPNIGEIVKVGGAEIVTLDFETARYLRRLDGEIYIGNECNLYKEDNIVKAVEDGNFSYKKWNGNGFDEISKNVEFNCAMAEFKEVSEPFVPEYIEELNIECDRKREWKKITVTGSEGFIKINYVGDAAQIYADGKMVADDFYYGKVWRVPASLLYNKECYLVVSEMKDDFYREF